MTNGDLDQRRVKAAHNQAVFREVNERVEELAHGFSPISFVCECLDTTCSATLSLTREEYEQVRAEPANFVVAPGHNVEEIEMTVLETDRYEVVQKLGVGYDVAAEASPRRSAH